MAVFYGVISGGKTAIDGLLDLMVDADDGSGRAQQPYSWRSGDLDGIGPEVDAWMQEHPDFPITPYTPPAPSTNPADYPLQRYQFLAMLTISNLASLVSPAIAAISDPVQRAVAQAKYDSTQIFQRDDATLNLLATNAGLTAAQVDAYWMQAKDL